MPDASSSTPTRHLRLEGTYNLRDLGGYGTLDGRTTRWRTFFRSDSLHRLSPAAQTALLDYGVRTVIDLRRSDELHAAPDVLASAPAVAYHQVSLAVDTPPVRGARPRPLVESYRRLLDERQEPLRQALAILTAPGGLPALVHCTAGKDRTGMLVALVLGVVGVPTTTIVADYALTAQYLVGTFLDEAQQRAARRGIPWEWYQPQMDCQPEFMLSALQSLEERYGGIAAYVRTIGVSDEECDRLRQGLVA